MEREAQGDKKKRVSGETGRLWGDKKGGSAETDTKETGRGDLGRRCFGEAERLWKDKKGGHGVTGRLQGKKGSPGNREWGGGLWRNREKVVAGEAR